MLDERVAKLESDMSAINSKVDALHAQTDLVRDDIAAIRSAVVGATKVGQFLKKHGPRVMAFLFGVAASSGYISQATANALRHLVGG